MACASHSLDQARDLARGHVLKDEVHGSDVDAELQGRCAYESAELARLELMLNALPLHAGKPSMMDRNVRSDHRESVAGPPTHVAGGDAHKARPPLLHQG